MTAPRKFQPGDKVHFSIDEDVVVMFGEVLNNLDKDYDGNEGAVHVACYFVVNEKDLDSSGSSGSTLVTN
jgi:hypothetical protein